MSTETELRTLRTSWSCDPARAMQLPPKTRKCFIFPGCFTSRNPRRRWNAALHVPDARRLFDGCESAFFVPGNGKKEKIVSGCWWWESPGAVSLCLISIHFAGQSGGCWMDASAKYVVMFFENFCSLSLRIFLQQQQGIKSTNMREWSC